MGGIDTHAHVFRQGLPLAAGRRYAPGYSVLPEDYLRQLDQHGLGGGVLVQPSFLGTDNGFLLDALQAHPERLRGIAVVEPDIDAAALEALDAAGIVGLRLNLVGAALPDLCAEPWPGLLRAVAGFGWQVELHREAGDLPTLLAPLLEHGLAVVVDHFGRPDPARGVDDPGFRHLLDAASTGRVWVKLSGAYRNGAGGRGEAVAAEAAPLLRQAFGPERLLWGSDWPHTQFESAVTYGDTLAPLATWLPDPDERRVVLESTPRSLFRFGPRRPA